MQRQSNSTALVHTATVLEIASKSVGSQAGKAPCPALGGADVTQKIKSDIFQHRTSATNGGGGLHIDIFYVRCVQAYKIRCRTTPGDQTLVAEVKISITVEHGAPHNMSAGVAKRTCHMHPHLKRMAAI